VIDKVLKIGMLFDFYGALLTEKQQYCIQMHYLNDFSLAEIADELGVSRQAVHDILKRAEQVLCDYEQKLKLVERYQGEQQQIESIHNLLVQLPVSVQVVPEIKAALSKLKNLLECTKEV
jgi:predicted DNA-binding protein YlxM (UPF0122 family)